MFAEEGAFTFRAKIGDTVLAGCRKDDRIREDNLMLIYATLKITEDIRPTRDVVAEMTKSLHNFAPCRRIVIPSTIAVKLLVVLDKRFAQNFLTSPVPGGIVGRYPHRGHVDFDDLVDDI